MSFRAFIQLGVFGALTFSTFIACSNKPILFSNDVNLTPLLDVPLPVYVEDLSEIMDTSLLSDHHRYDHSNSLREKGEWMEEWRYSRYKKTNGQSGTIQVILILDSTIADAKAFFPAGCFVEEVYRNELNENTKYFDQVYISFLEESRAGPEGLYAPLGYFTSCIAIRQGNLIIEFNEITDFSDRSQVNEIIEELANAFYEKPD